MGTSVNEGKACRKDYSWLLVLNLPLCHWSSQLFDLHVPSSTDVPVLLLNQLNVVPWAWCTKSLWDIPREVWQRNLYFVGVMRKMFFQSVTQEAQTMPELLTGFKTFDLLFTNPDALQYVTGAMATKLGPYNVCVHVGVVYKVGKLTVPGIPPILLSHLNTRPMM